MHRAALLAATLSVTVGVLLFVSGCAGNGDGLDENGRPIDSGPLPLAPTFASIQQNVFTPICTACHAGASAPLGLRLDEANAYAAIVNTPSVEVSSLRRIRPGDPDASYLIQKIEGRAAVGGRMPLGQSALPQATIDVIKQWVADGAQRPAVTATADKPATLLAISPLADEILTQPPSEVVIASPSEIDTSLVQTGAVEVVGSGGDGSFAEGNEFEVAVQVTVRSQSPTTLVVTKSDGAFAPDSYRLSIAGTGSLAASDLDGRPIDGDADGQSGGDFVEYFDIGRAL
jgi:hypothetical protein